MFNIFLMVVEVIIVEDFVLLFLEGILFELVIIFFKIGKLNK